MFRCLFKRLNRLNQYALTILYISILFGLTSGCQSKDERLFSAISDCEFKKAEELIVAGANINARSKDGNTVLIHAIKNCPILVPRILQNGADINTKASNGDTPIHIAIREQNAEITDLLLKSGADIKEKNEYGDTPLHIASRLNSITIAKLLYSGTEYVNEKNNNGDTAIYGAIANNQIEMVELLLQWRAYLYLDTQNNNGDTPLHLAAKHPSILKLLLSYIDELLVDNEVTLERTNLGIQNKDGNTPLHIIAKYGLHECGEIIQHYFAENNEWMIFEQLVRIQNKDGNTALHLWYMSENTDFNTLIKLGSVFDVNAIAQHLKNYSGMTPNDLYQQRLSKYIQKEKCHISTWKIVEDFSSDQLFIKNIAGQGLIVLPWGSCLLFKSNIAMIQTSVILDGVFPYDMQRPLSMSLIECYNASLYPRVGKTELLDIATDCNGKWF